MPSEILAKKAPGGWWIDAHELHFGEQVLVPDIPES